MVDSYTTVFNAANTNYDFANYAFSNWLDFHNGVLDFDKNDHWGNSSILDRAINESARAFNAKNKAFYNFNWQYYEEDYRVQQYKVVESELERLNDLYKDWYDERTKVCDDLQNKIQTEILNSNLILKCWHFLIFPGRCQPSIFSTTDLNYRVRDGNGCTLGVISTNIMSI